MLYNEKDNIDISSIVFFTGVFSNCEWSFGERRLEQEEIGNEGAGLLRKFSLVKG
jgi:hypothetical protein